MLNGFDPLKDFWKPSSYAKKRNYIWMMPMVSVFAVYILIVNKIDDIWIKIKKK